MPLAQNQTPYKHSPKGASDSTDETQLFPGAMLQLANLVPAPDTLNHWIPRQAMTQLPGSATPVPAGQFCSASIIVGNYWFGMVSQGNGFDYPVGYNLLTNTPIAISGPTTSNTPASLATSGAWTPPCMCLVGVYIVVTHIGFSGTGANFFGAINISNPAAPAWTAQNTATTALASVPIWCAQFFGRAYYVVPGAIPALVASDSLAPLTRTNATYVITLGDTVPIVCAAGLGLDNQVTGGQVQSLIAFKANLTMWQITGDFALTGAQGTQVNALNVATGTFAPNTVQSSPKGLMFAAPDGVRLIDFNANVSPPIGLAGSGIALPFINSSVPSRMTASCNAVAYRITTINGGVTGGPTQEWIYHIERGIWHGPHTSWSDQIEAWATNFVIFRHDQPGLYLSSLIPSASSTYTEFGAPITCTYQTALLPERQDMRMCSTVEGIFYQGSGAGGVTYNISALNQNGSVIQFVQVAIVGGVTLWDQFEWGVSVGLGMQQTLAAQMIPWTQPVIFDRMSIQISFTAAAGGRIGDLYMIYELLGFTAQP